MTLFFLISTIFFYLYLATSDTPGHCSEDIASYKNISKTATCHFYTLVFVKLKQRN